MASLNQLFRLNSNLAKMKKLKKRRGAAELPKRTRQEISSSLSLPRGLRSGAPISGILLIFVLLAGRLFVMIRDFAVNIFFYDQWDFDDANLFQSHTLWEMFRWQHGPHRQGLGALLARLIEPQLRWNSRSESFVVWTIIVLAACCALYLKKRIYGQLSGWDVIIPLIFFIPSQFETLFITANLAHGPLPLLLILCYCLAWTLPNVFWRYALVVLINFATLYTGFGLFLGLITPFLLVLDYWGNGRLRGSRHYFLIALVLSIVSLGSFFVGYVFQPAVDCFADRPESLVPYGWFVALMFANFFGAKEGTILPTLAGCVCLAALLACVIFCARNLLIRNDPRWRRTFVVATLLCYCLLFCANTAVGRVCTGLSAAFSSRYVIYMELGILGLYFALLTVGRRLLRIVLLAVLTTAMVATLPMRRGDLQAMMYYQSSKEKWKNCYLQLGNIHRCDQLVGQGVYPNPDRNHLQEKLDFLKKTRQNLFSDSE